MAFQCIWFIPLLILQEPVRNNRRFMTNCDIKVKKASISQLQLRPAPPAPPRHRAEGRFPAFSVLEYCKFCGHYQILRCPGSGIFPTLDQPWAFDTHVVSYPEDHCTEDFSGKTSRSAHLPRTGKIVEVEGSKGVFSVLCMHSFISKLGAIDVNQDVFSLLNQISVDIIWITSFHIYKTIQNRYDNLTANY